MSVEGEFTGRLFCVIETFQECNKEKEVSNAQVFTSQDKAVRYLHERYLCARDRVDAGSGEFAADYSDEGWYVVVDQDGDSYEGVVREMDRADFWCKENGEEDGDEN